MTDMETAYKVAAIAVRERFAEQHPQDLETLNGIRPEQVAVYSGTYDQAEEVLQCLGIPAMVNPNPKTLAAQIVFVNCSSNYDPDLVDRIGNYVEQGKWLVTSDWALDRIIERAFPNMVRWDQKSTGEEIISVEPHLKSLWSDIVVLGADPQWWLWGSHPIEVLNPDRVQIEAASHDLLVRYNAPVVAVRFEWGRGQVFHVISHFWAKRSHTPTAHHQQPYTEFLKMGMKLSDRAIERVCDRSGIELDTLNFAQLQSAATATELVAQLCVSACCQVLQPTGNKSGKII
jgi:hypothetical protein